MIHIWLVLIATVDCVLTRTALHANAVADRCRSDADCTRVVMHSRCANGMCIRREGFAFDGLFRCGRWKRYRRQSEFGIRMLGEECHSNDDCRRTPVDGEKVCVLNRCQCSTGHVPIDAYRCIRDFEQLSSNTRLIKSAEKDEPPGYGSICLTSKDCQHSTTQLECLRGSCVCLEGHVPLGKYLCYNVRGGDGPVTDSSTTNAALPSTALPPLETDDDDDDGEIQPLGKLTTSCANNDYCRQSVPHSRCLDSKCTCIEGYMSLDLYTCVEDVHQEMTTLATGYKSLLGGQCHTNRNCQTFEAVCLNNMCTCPSGSFAIDDWNCLSETGVLNERLVKMPRTTTTTMSTTTTTVSTTAMLWWPWSSSTSSRRSITAENAFPIRCFLHRQCAALDANAHCTSWGRCVCNVGFGLETKGNEAKCVRKLNEEDDCD